MIIRASRFENRILDLRRKKGRADNIDNEVSGEMSDHRSFQPSFSKENAEGDSGDAIETQGHGHNQGSDWHHQGC